MDPTLKFKTIRQLKEKFSDLAPRLKLVAKYVTDNPADFGLDSIRTTSQKIGVSTFTLVRMAKTLGFESYDEFREPFRQALVTISEVSDDPSWLKDMAAKGDIGKEQAKTARNTITNVQRSLHLIDPEKMDRVVTTLFSAKTVYITAVRATYSLAYYFHYIGRMSLPSLRLIPRYINSTIDELNTVGPDDVLIAVTFTPYSNETIEACRFAARRGARIILITDSDLVVPDLEPAEVLVASTLSTHYFACFSGAMAVMENLIALMVQKGGKDALENIRSYEELRDEFSAYWKGVKKH